MNIIKFALQAEAEGEKLYRDMAAKTDSPGMKGILNMLADDENKHARMINFYVQEKNLGSSPMKDTVVLETAKDLFADLKNSMAGILNDASMKTLFEQAIEEERKSKDLYLQYSVNSKDPHEKQLLKFLAIEENKHQHLLENMMEFMMKPDSYLDSDEFKSFDQVPSF